MISCFSTALIDAFGSLLFHSVIFSLGGPLPHSSPVVFDPARLVIRVMINKLYFVPEWLVSDIVGML